MQWGRGENASRDAVLLPGKTKHLHFRHPVSATRERPAGGPEALPKTGGGRALVQTTEFRLFQLIGVSQSQKMGQQKLALGLQAQISATSPGSRTRRF